MVAAGRFDSSAKMNGANKMAALAGSQAFVKSAKNSSRNSL